MKIKYHPVVCTPGVLTEEVIRDAYAYLLKDFPLMSSGPVTLGHDTQYDRTVGGDGSPGEYVQFYILWGDED